MIKRWLFILDNMYRAWPTTTWFVAICALIMAITIANGGRI